MDVKKYDNNVVKLKKTVYCTTKYYYHLNSATNNSVQIYLPRFKISTSSDFLNYLRGVEIDNPTGNSGALGMGFAQQAVTIETDEDGTTAAVVSGVGLEPTMVLPQIFDFNKPFVFVINEKQTGS